MTLLHVILCTAAAALLATTHPLGARQGRDGLEYVWIPAGTFWMGCVTDAECEAAEKPRHRVTLTHGFWMSRTEVDVASFRRFVRSSGYRPSADRQGRGRVYRVRPGPDGEHWAWVNGVTWDRPLVASEPAPDAWPAVQVSWRDAVTYCTWLGGRLPSSAEWERAARGGREGEVYPWGSAPTPEVDGVKYANGPSTETKQAYPAMETFQAYSDGYVALAPVAQFVPNPFGLFDMAGNVWEYVADWYSPDYYTDSPDVDPKGPRQGAYSEGDFPIIRGGGWNYYPFQLRSSYLGYLGGTDDFWTASVGFRCVLDTSPG